MTREALVDLDAIRSNLAVLSTATAATPAMVIVKANAYGHTLALALPALAGADGVAVQTLDEARDCRQLGWRKPILIMGDELDADALADPVLHPLHLCVNGDAQIVALERHSGPQRPYAWLRCHGDLHHAGHAPGSYRQAWARLQRLQAADRLAGLGHLLHYADADDPERLRAERTAFDALLAGLPGPRCQDNSAALLSGPPHARRPDDWVRCGIALYGISPFPQHDGGQLGLQPAMRLCAPLFDEQWVRAGAAVGYGGLFHAPRRMRIGLVRCGYADGYPRTLHPGAAVLIEGRPCPIIGRNSMDLITVDLSEQPQVRPGALATLWGTPDLSVESVARAADTIAAQLCVGLTARVPRLDGTQAHQPDDTRP